MSMPEPRQQASRAVDDAAEGDNRQQRGIRAVRSQNECLLFEREGPDPQRFAKGDRRRYAGGDIQSGNDASRSTNTCLAMNKHSSVGGFDRLRNDFELGGCRCLAVADRYLNHVDTRARGQIPNNRYVSFGAEVDHGGDACFGQSHISIGTWRGASPESLCYPGKVADTGEPLCRRTVQNSRREMGRGNQQVERAQDGRCRDQSAGQPFNSLSRSATGFWDS